MVPALRFGGFLLFVLAAGCAGVKDAPPSVIAQQPSPIAAPAPVAPLTPETAALQTIENRPAADTPAPAVRQSVAKAATLPAKAAAAVSVPAPIVAQPLKTAVPPPAAVKPQPTLDMTALVARLRDTSAIGVFTKLALKNQVDDLLKKFKAVHQGGQKTSVASLRPPYDMLVLKVLAVIQDNDPSLAREISGSREAIWGILADPVKFNSLA